VTSDHPMFALKIRDGYNALVFPERDCQAFANRIEELLSSPALYAQLSANAVAAADAFLCPLKFDQLISGFLGLDPTVDLRKSSLTSCYPDYVRA
jgi:glycosyltransferase involved in cell wall biosynthesis